MSYGHSSPCDVSSRRLTFQGPSCLHRPNDRTPAWRVRGMPAQYRTPPARPGTPLLHEESFPTSHQPWLLPSSPPPWLPLPEPPRLPPSLARWLASPASPPWCSTSFSFSCSPSCRTSTEVAAKV